MAALQGILLLLAASGYLPLAATQAVAALALGTLVWSFGRDILWLYRTSRPRTAPVASLVSVEQQLRALVPESVSR